MCRRLVLWCCLAATLGFVGSQAFGATLDLRITNGANDAEEHLADGSMDVTSTDLEFPYEDNGNPSATDLQLNVLRFNVALPKGAVVTKAYLELEQDETKGNDKPVNVIIDGQLTLNAPAITSAARNLSSRTPWTAANVKWTVPTGMKNDQKFQSPDITAILTEIINQDGWVSGNALLLAIRDDPENPSKGLRCVESVEGEATAAPLLHIEAVVAKATNPDPKNGATEVTSPLFQWTAGDTAVTHKIYMGTSPTITEADLVSPGMPAPMYFHVAGLTPGATYYWRVDEVALDGTVTVGDVWSFSVMPLTAHFPTPADGATNIATAGQLKWSAGQDAIAHMVYLSSDKAAVTSGAVSVQVAAGTDLTYNFTGLQPFTTYYWRVDEVTSMGQTVAGPVWSFSTVSYLSLADAAVTLNYNNSAAPFFTETVLTGATDWTAYGLSDLIVQFTGRAGPSGGLTYDASNQTYTLTGSGTDIWNNSDQFHYAYKTLSGDGTMVARVTTIGAGANTWAKGGVMIRQSLAAGSTHAYMPLTANSDGTAGNGASFQRRLAADGASSNSDSGVKIVPPYWVKIERKGADFSGFVSPDGQTWTQIGTAQTIAMADPVLIGLAVTSHDAATQRTFTFDGVATTGNVAPDGPFSAWDDIGLASNDPQPIFAAVEDAAGKQAVVAFGDPAATQIAQPWTWKIPLSAFAGVDLKTVAKLHLGVGDLLNPVAGGSGVVTFNSVRVVRPVVLAKGADVTAPDDNVLGVPNNKNWPAAEPPWLAIDDKTGTKFLHFNGKTEPVGFQVQVLAGPTIVTGLSLTTANDAVERDPVAFELSGSNDGFAGPWTLIAKGDIADFAGATAWERFTKNTTPITFPNKVAYKFYQVLFTAVRDPAAANSMQIGEVELLNGGPNVIWVSDAYDDKKDGVRDDEAWVGFLASQGFNVDYRMGAALGNGYWRVLDQAKIDALNAADLIIFSRNLNSGDYNNSNERNQWNGIKAPLLSLAMHQLRSSHWKWFNTTTINATVPVMKPVDVANAAFTGVTLDANGQIQALAAGMSSSFPGVKDAGNGTVIATRADTGDVWIASWAAGTEFYAGSGQIPAGPRVFFAGATQETVPTIGRGELNLTDSGQAVFLNVVDTLLP
ncbi:MAG: DUF1349 domain-containing protein [Planctomycetes bacterium]|jgi:hypothetical protein|nr:DUF1349 domain-containing protein [Planctomycetota bacterium]